MYVCIWVVYDERKGSRGGEWTTPIQVRTMLTSDMQMLSTTIAIHAHHMCVCVCFGVSVGGKRRTAVSRFV